MQSNAEAKGIDNDSGPSHTLLLDETVACDVEMWGLVVGVMQGIINKNSG